MYSKRNRIILYDEVRIANAWFSPETAFFVVGRYQDLPLSNERTYFEINSAWLLRGLKGRNLANQPEPTLKIDELLKQNLEEALDDIYST